MKTDVSIPMPGETESDGKARAFVFTPDAGSGPWPAVIIYMDAPAIRPAMFEMGERMAQAGYYVLLPDIFWRAGPYAPIDFIKARQGDPDAVAQFGKLRASTDAARQMKDTGVWLDWLSKQPQAKADKVGVTGYCMGGGIALRAAGTYPDRIAAAGAFHGGNMATDDEGSPHRLAPKMKARILVAGADEDRGFDEAQCERLDAALKDAGVDAKVSIWKGVKHGWVPTDMPVHDPAGAERHWQEITQLFDETLKPPAAA